MEEEAGALAWDCDELAGESAAFGVFSEGRSWPIATEQKFSVSKIKNDIFAKERRASEQNSARDGRRGATKKRITD
jgi:hypothetical protein